MLISTIVFFHPSTGKNLCVVILKPHVSTGLSTASHAMYGLNKKNEMFANLASKNLDLRIITASQVLCFSCISIAVNFFLIMLTIRSISFGAMGRVRLCSRSRFTTCVVNSLHACN